MRSPHPDHDEAILENWATSLYYWSKFDWGDYIEQVWQGLVYISRYGSDSIESTMNWPISRVLRTLHYLSDIVKRENTSD